MFTSQTKCAPFLVIKVSQKVQKEIKQQNIERKKNGNSIVSVSSWKSDAGFTRVENGYDFVRVS